MITNLHPALLAVKAKFSIATHYSTAFQSIHYIGGITIEYTDQKEVYRKKLNYKPKRPEFTSFFLMMMRIVLDFCCEILKKIKSRQN